MARQKKEQANIITLDSFGSAKNYWTAWVRSPLQHFAFANFTRNAFAKKCAFVGNISLEDDTDKLLFPAYFLSFNEEYAVDLTIIANRISAPASISSKKENPLFGGLLFEDDYYIFNTNGFKKIQSCFESIDYLLLFSADNCIDPEDYINFVKESRQIDIIDEGVPAEIAKKQKNRKQFFDFLQYLFYETETMIRQHRHKRLSARLHNKMSVSANNYGKLKFPVEDERVITSPYLRREDL